MVNTRAALQEILASPKQHNQTTFTFRRKTVWKPFNLHIVLILKVNIQEGVYATKVHVNEREKLHIQCNFIKPNTSSLWNYSSTSQERNKTSEQK